MPSDLLGVIGNTITHSLPVCEYMAVSFIQDGLTISRIALQVDQYIHRILVQEDHGENNEDLFSLPSMKSIEFYKKGDLSESGITDIDIYILKKV